MAADFGSRAAAVLDEAMRAGAFPGATAEAGSSDAPLWSHATGRHTYDPGARSVTTDTIYDLASLTKVIATTSATMRLVGRDALDLDAPAHTWMPEWRDGPFRDVRVHDLLEHASGLAAWAPLYREHPGPDSLRQAIAEMTPEYPPRTMSVYSDLGFMVLGIIIASAADASLDAQFDAFRAESALPPRLRYGAAGMTNVAPTEFDPWRGRVPHGEVHDENAAAFGRAAPQAGLFGAAADVGAFARLVLRTYREETALGTPALMTRFATRSTVPGSSRALGWDTMLPTSSCGAHMSARAIGHTGFTGTSLWIDPERDRYYVLLSNRVHPTRENQKIQGARRAFHDAFAN